MIDAATFMNLLHRGGSFHYLWRWEGKESTWRPTSAILPDVSGHFDVYFGVHPTSCIPPTNAEGEPKPPKYVRGRKDIIEAVNCLFAEFDGKNFDKNDPRGKGLALALTHIDSLPSAPTVLIRSGGGFHAYWLLRDTWLLHAPEEMEMAERVQFAWVDHVKGDKAAKDLARVLRVPGTRNGKYPDKPLVEIVEYDPLRVYTLDELTEGLNLSDVSSSPPNTQENHERGPALMLDDEQILTLARNARNGAKFERLWAGDLSDYGGDHSSADAGLCALLAFYTREPAQLDRLFRSSGLMRPKWDAVHYADGSTYGAGTIKSALEKVTTQYNPAHNGNGHALEEPDWMNEVPSLLGDEAALSIASLPEGRNEIPPMGDAKPKPAGFVTLAQVGAFYGSVKWAWPDWIPSGHVTMVAGPQGTGKSYLLAYLAGVFVGAIPTWPDGVPFEGTPGPVLLCDTEEMRGAYAQRLVLLGVQDGQVILPSPNGDVTYTPSLPKDLALVERLAQEHGCSAILIDSLSGGHALDENSAAMRQILQGLTRLAATLQIPVIVAHHARKRSSLEAVRLTLDRIRGSSAISQFCRSVIGMYRMDEHDLTAPVRVEPLKCSFCKPPEAFGLTITDTGLSFHEAPEEDKPLTVTDKACDFLRDKLDRSPADYRDLVEKAEAEGISRTTLYRARNKLGIISVGNYWGLPARGGPPNDYETWKF